MMYAPPITLAFTPGLAIAGAVAMSVPIIIHLLSRFRRKREPWGAMRFLMEAFRKHRRRLHLEQIILLAVRCLLLLTLGLALSGPVLSGCAGRLAGGLDASGRVVYLVMDDALTSRAAAGPDVTRFDELKRTALSMLDSLSAGDRVALVQAASPMKEALTPPTLDIAAARRAIESMQPRYTRTDLPAALAAVLESIDREDVLADRAFVVVLSDLSGSALDAPMLASGAPATIRTLGERARIVVRPPMVGVANVQIAAAAPRRTAVFIESAMPASVPMELQLRRFDTDAPATVTPVEIAVINDEGRPIGDPLRRDVRWSSGQTTATLNVELPLTAPAGDDHGPTTVVVAARLTDSAAGDALTEDDMCFAVIELRRRINVAIVADPATSLSASGGGGGFTPRQWLSLALTPLLRNGVVESMDITPDAINAQQLPSTPLDAALVTRPDMLSVQGWQMLRQLAQSGGLVWVFVPTSDAPSIWGQTMTSAFDLPWQVGLEPLDSAGTSLGMGLPGGVTPSDAVSNAQSLPSASWIVDVNTPVPEPLSLLAADWVDLLRPIRFTKRLDLTVREGQDKVWLAVAGDKPMLAAADVGDGKLLLLATALDADWTNLPTKPLFVPLLHETLRSVLGGSIESSRRQAVTAGTTPALSRRWLGAQQLARVGAAETIALTTSGTSVTPAGPLELPGVWQALPESAGRRLAVNVDADGGDARAIDPARLSEWLSTLGAWTFLDPTQPATALLVQREATDIGWPLLWTVLMLALIETLLARRFSHADQSRAVTGSTGAAGLLRRAIAAIGDRDDSQQRAA